MSMLNVNKEKTVGVIGGLGPKATLDFYAKLLEKTAAASDQDHLQVIINSNPKVPNRQSALAGTGPSCAPHLVDSAVALKRAGADFLVMVCNTAHAYERDIKAAAQLPFVSIIEESVNACLRQNRSLKKVGLLAADGCLDAELYQKQFAQHGVECVVPSTADQQTLMQLIFRIKAGEQALEIALEMERIAQSLIDADIEAILAACTEVPLVLQDEFVTVPLVSSTDVLVDAVIAYARNQAGPLICADPNKLAAYVQQPTAVSA